MFCEVELGSEIVGLLGASRAKILRILEIFLSANYSPSMNYNYHCSSFSSIQIKMWVKTLYLYLPTCPILLFWLHTTTGGLCLDWWAWEQYIKSRFIKNSNIPCIWNCWRSDKQKSQQNSEAKHVLTFDIMVSAKSSTMRVSQFLCGNYTSADL